MKSPSVRLLDVRVHNLKLASVRFPHAAISVISGVSGSGKSSLAFDTLFAEGQRRYVECLSTYARQFLDRVPRPDLGRADGLLPALAIDRRPLATQARSTVGTATEIHDYLRVLFARIGEPHCLGCSRPVRIEPVETVVDELLGLGGRGVIAFEAEVPSGTRAFSRWIERLRADGFARVWQDGRAVTLDQARPATGRRQVVLDRLEFTSRQRSRLAEAVEAAYRFGHDRCCAHPEDGAALRFSRRLHCASCDRSYRPCQPASFSPNSPLGACPDCQGFGRSIDLDFERIVPDPSRTLAERPIDPWNKPAYRSSYRDLRRAGKGVGLPWDRPYRELSAEHRRWVEQGGTGFYGIRGFFEWLSSKTYKVHVRVFLARYRAYRPCTSCGGTGLCPEALAITIDGSHIAEVASWPVHETRRWVDALAPTGARATVAAPVLDELRRRLRFLDEVGLGYLTLSRQSRTLSGGEAQRIQLARCLGSGLTDTLYVLDEPSVGLHPREVDGLIAVLRRLRDQGNTVVLVEHDPRVLAAADHLIDLGPGAGEAGGRLLYEGPVSQVGRARDSLTGDYLMGRRQVAPPQERPAQAGAAGWIVLEGADTHNLREVTARFPKACLTVVTGVSGSGKSSLVHDTLYGALARRLERTAVAAGDYRALLGTEGLGGVDLVDQSPIGRSPRSNPVTYVKAFDPIRRRLAATGAARARGLRPAHFSFNVPGGRCEACAGAGSVKIEMHFLADLDVPCEACGGGRFSPQVLEVRYRGRNVVEILDSTVDQAIELFADAPDVLRRLERLREIGLGYLRLGQPAPTLSGGEAQRLKLAAHLDARGGRPRVLLLDEPTTGLHLHDLSVLIGLLRRLVEVGHTVIVVEHHLELIRAADWIVDLGPGAGPAGGRLVAEGPPGTVARSGGPTGAYLAVALGGPALKGSKPARPAPPRRASSPGSSPRG